MPKFAVISGFLGSGKTTVMMALTKHDPAVAMISNDLGEGVELADHRFAKLSGCSADQITDACICFCHDRLIETVEARFAEGKTLVVSDIPGFGVGALEHVYHGLAGKLDFAPFTVLVEPATIQALRAGEDLAHIQDAQLREAVEHQKELDQQGRAPDDPDIEPADLPQHRHLGVLDHGHDHGDHQRQGEGKGGQRQRHLQPVPQ